MSAAVLAIDGGNSKTDVALISAEGDILATAHGPGTSMDAVRYPRSTALLSELVGKIATEVGIEPGAVIAEHVSACHAGLDIPQEEARLLADLTAWGWGRTNWVGNDTFAVLRAGTIRPWGVAVTCGAGINAVGVAPDGATTRFLALGKFTGDWGGGRDLAEEVLFWSARAEDGRGEPTALAAATAAHFGVADMHEVCVGIHLGDIRPADLHQLTPLLFRVAEEGDKIAGQIVDRMADEVTLMALAAMRKLDLTGRDTEVVLGGSVLAARHARLVDRISALVHAEAPAAVIRVIEPKPVVGAALLGLDHIGADTTAHARLLAGVAAG